MAARDKRYANFARLTCPTLGGSSPRTTPRGSTGVDAYGHEPRTVASREVGGVARSVSRSSLPPLILDARHPAARSKPTDRAEGGNYGFRTSSPTTMAAGIAATTTARVSKRRSRSAVGATVGCSHRTGSSRNAGHLRRAHAMIRASRRLSIAALSALCIARGYGRAPRAPSGACQRPRPGPFRRCGSARKCDRGQLELASSLIACAFLRAGGDVPGGLRADPRSRPLRKAGHHRRRDSRGRARTTVAHRRPPTGARRRAVKSPNVGQKCAPDRR
jgi:hypothetical protein